MKGSGSGLWSSRFFLGGLHDQHREQAHRGDVPDDDVTAQRPESRAGAK